MDKIIKRMSERLAAQSSRRGFFSVLGGGVLGVVALVTGQGFFAQAADAASSLHCCTGRACSSTHCPSGSSIHYTWHCGHPSGGGYYVCHDCYSTTTHHLVCVYATYHA
jgi:hypothetical protein